MTRDATTNEARCYEGYGGVYEQRKRSASPTGFTSHHVRALAFHRLDGSTHRVRAHNGRPAREMFYAKRYVELEEYRKDMLSGKFKNLTREDKYAMYGTTIVPIHVPLASGETKDEYKRRFAAWLSRIGLSLESLEKDENEHIERQYWFKFARRNVLGDEKFEPPFPEKERDSVSRTQGLSPKRKAASLRPVAEVKALEECQVENVPEDGPIDTVVNSHVKCGCQYCLLLGMRALMQRLGDVQKRVSQGCQCGPEAIAHELVLDITLDDSSSPKRRKLTAEAIQKVVSPWSTRITGGLQPGGVERDATVQTLEDSVLIHLLGEYESVLREPVDMENKAATLTLTRSEAAASVIMHLWRHRRSELMQLVKQAEVSDDKECSHTEHTQCSSLAARIREKRRYAVQIRRHLDRLLQNDADAPPSERKAVLLLSERLNQTEDETEALERQRRAAFEALVRCDAVIRTHITTQCSDET